jgi:AcrR family transcriptional regulator
MSSVTRSNPETTTSPGRIGRPRERRADRAILEAALELIAEDGVRDLRVDDVAERARVGKATIYRRYRSKDELVTAAVDALVSEIAIPDTGSTRGDLLGLMRGAVEVYSGSLEAGVIRGLADAIRRDPELARSVRDGFLGPRRTALRTVLERGIERGDLREGLDFELALDVFAGPLFYRLLFTGGPIDKRLADGVVELTMRGFGPERHPQSKTRRKAKR